jgi:hypothetical protein
VVGADGMEGTTLKVVRQEFAGQVSAHVHADISKGAVITVRSGAFRPAEAGAAGEIVDRSAEAAVLTARRKFVELVEAEAGDIDITREDVLVSVGRGIGDKRTSRRRRAQRGDGRGVLLLSDQGREMPGAAAPVGRREKPSSRRSTSPSASAGPSSISASRGTPSCSRSTRTRRPAIQAHRGVVADLMGAPGATEKIKRPVSKAAAGTSQV